MKRFHLRSLVLLLCLNLVVPVRAGAENALAPRPWNSEIIYHVMVDRYSRDGAPVDPRGKKPNDYWGGTIKGVTAHLNEIQGIGFTTILLTPVTDSVSYHGYDVLDLFKVNPHFGNLADYQELIRECHKRNIRILFDFVGNHMSSKSVAFAKHKDWFRPPLFGVGVNSSATIERWTTSSFYELPDLIQENEEVYQHLFGAAKYWIGQGVDGFRMDAVTLIAPSFWKRFNADVRRAAPPGFLVLGEIYSTDDTNLDLYEPWFDAVFDFRFYEYLAMNLRMEVDRETLVNAWQGRWKNSTQTHFPVRFIDNHDTGRLVSAIEYSNADKRAQLGLAFLMLSPGVPSVLYGTETLIQDYIPITSDSMFDSARSAMDFGHSKVTDVRGMLTKLIRLRKEFDLNGSERRFIAGTGASDLVIEYYRNPKTNQRMVVVMNFSDAKDSAVVDLKAFPAIPPGSEFIDVLTGQAIASTQEKLKISLNEWGVTVLKVAR